MLKKKLSDLAFWLTQLLIPFFLCKTTDFYLHNALHNVDDHGVIFMVNVDDIIYICMFATRLCVTDSFYTAISILCLGCKTTPFHAAAAAAALPHIISWPQQYNSKHTSINNIII